MSVTFKFALLLLYQLNCSVVWTRHADEDYSHKAVRRSLIGIDTADISGIVVFNPNPGQSAHEDVKPVSLHIVIPTIGRRKIMHMLASIEKQIEVQDMITVIFDGDHPQHLMSEVQAKLNEMPGLNMVVLAPSKKKRSDVGYSARNNYRNRGGDFVLFADDDNYYMPDAFSTVRSTVQGDHNALYVFQVNFTTGHAPVPNVWSNANTIVANIDTGGGVTPTKYARYGEWKSEVDPDLGYGCCGDHHFYDQISSYVPRTYFIAKVIYMHTGQHIEERRARKDAKVTVDSQPASDLGRASSSKQETSSRDKLMGNLS